MIKLFCEQYIEISIKVNDMYAIASVPQSTTTNYKFTLTEVIIMAVYNYKQVKWHVNNGNN